MDDKLKLLFNHEAFASLRPYSKLENDALSINRPHGGEVFEAKVRINTANNWYRLSTTTTEAFHTIKQICSRLDDMADSFIKRINSITKQERVIEDIKSRIAEVTEHKVVVEKKVSPNYNVVDEYEVFFPANTVKMTLGDINGGFYAFLKVGDLFGENSKAKIKILIDSMSKLEIIERI